MSRQRRSTWVLRGILAAVVVAPLAPLAWVSPAWALAVAPILGTIELGCWFATRRHLAALEEGVGEVLFVTGEVLPRDLLLRLRRWEAAESAGGAAAVLVAVGVTWGTPAAFATLMVALLSAALLGLVTFGRWVAWRQLDALLALIDHDPALALERATALKRVRSAADSVRGIEARALLQLGRAAEGRRLQEEGWTGELDARASALAVDRIGRGDLSLAERWMKADRPDDRFHRYLAALVGGHLALARGDAAAVHARITPVLGELPRYYQRDLVLLRAAADQLAGDTEGARAHLATLDDVASEAWRRHPEPLLWKLVEDARAGRPSHGLPRLVREAPKGLPEPVETEPADAFAPPEAELAATPTPRARPELGALPAEWVPLGSRRERFRLVRLVLVGILAVLVAVLAALLLLVGQPLAALGSLALGAGFVAVVAAGEALRRRLRRPGPAALLSDGTRLAEAPLALWWVWGALPGVAALGGLTLAPVLIEVASIGSAWTLALSALLGWLTWWHVRTRTRALRAVHAAHFGDPDHAVLIAANLPSWKVLATLVAGRPDDALEVLKPLLPLRLPGSELAAWVRAGRGEVDLDRLLALRPEPGDGPAFRREVTLRLAALHEGRPERVLTHVEDAAELADALPNRFGGMLHRLNHEILTRVDPVAAARYAETHAGPIALGRWVERCWPALVTSTDER